MYSVLPLSLGKTPLAYRFPFGFYIGRSFKWADEASSQLIQPSQTSQPTSPSRGGSTTYGKMLFQHHASFPSHPSHLTQHKLQKTAPNHLWIPLSVLPHSAHQGQIHKQTMLLISPLREGLPLKKNNRDKMREMMLSAQMLKPTPREHTMKAQRIRPLISHSLSLADYLQSKAGTVSIDKEIRMIHSLLYFPPIFSVWNHCWFIFSKIEARDQLQPSITTVTSFLPTCSAKRLFVCSRQYFYRLSRCFRRLHLHPTLCSTAQFSAPCKCFTPFSFFSHCTFNWQKC